MNILEKYPKQAKFYLAGNMSTQHTLYPWLNPDKLNRIVATIAEKSKAEENTQTNALSNENISQDDIVFANMFLLYLSLSLGVDEMNTKALEEDEELLSAFVEAFKLLAKEKQKSKTVTAGQRA